MYRKLIGATVLLVLGLGALPAVAAEGRIPLPFAGPPPYVLAAPGKYIVTRNLGIAAGPLLDVAANDVEIDLNGMQLTSGDLANAVIRSVAGNNGLAVRNGTIIGGKNSIEVIGGARVVIEDVKSVGVGGSSEGIRLFGVSNFTVRRNIFDASGLYGLWVESPGPVPVTGTIEGNQFESCGGGIAVLNGSAVGILHNRVHQTSTDHGILLVQTSGSLIAENTLERLAIDGIHITTPFFGGAVANKLLDNVIHRTSNFGIYLDPGVGNNLLLNNVLDAAGSFGLVVEGYQNNLEANTLNGNGGFGMYFSVSSFGNVYRRNMARGNGGGGCFGFPFTADICDQTGGNTSFGDNFMPVLL